MKRKILRFFVWAVLLVAVFAFFAEMFDRALYQLDYKLCKQTPLEVRHTDCTERLKP